MLCLSRDLFKDPLLRDKDREKEKRNNLDDIQTHDLLTTRCSLYHCAATTAQTLVFTHRTNWTVLSKLTEPNHCIFALAYTLSVFELPLFELS